MAHDAWDLRLDLIGGSRSGVYPVTYGRVHGAVVLSAGYAF
jgi:hypothetical protein